MDTATLTAPRKTASCGFNNPQTPDGSVRAMPASEPDKAALRVAFDALSEGTDRFVLWRP